jgi:hypothetical protein
MAHYATLNDENIVTSIFVGKDENNLEPNITDWEDFYRAKRTSYNTRGGVYYNPNSSQPHLNQSKAFRKNYAGIGYTYDEQRDAFIPPQPYPSWVLDEFSCLWNSPIAHPDNGHIPSYYLPYHGYYWNEECTNWSLNKPFPSWQVSIEGYYISPIPHPNDGNLYYWSEDTILWIRYEI